MLTGSHREQRFGYISGSENLKITTVSRPVLCLPTGHQDHMVYALPNIPLYQVTAVQGDPVYMPCNISTSEEGDAVVIVLWYREDLGTPIYTVDTRDRSILQADRWSADNVFANRAYFMPDKVPAELGVDHVKESDAGVYRCRVDFRKAQTRNTRVNLTVIEGKQKTFQIWRLDSNLL
ncbi:hypothetical protein RUM43_006886 [Polyplax serrata]|uniref:Ig-like domain-containing protein n=1 Tax=Polyplax serrata TaxID=468196 RepID=A0AAN8P142_POLSC